MHMPGPTLRVRAAREEQDRSAEHASRLMHATAAREVITPDPTRSFRAFTHDYPTPIAGWHYHPELEIHLITASTGTVIVGDHVGSFQPGQVWLIGSGLPHDWVSDLAPGEVVHGRDHVIQFDLGWLGSCEAVMPELGELDPLIRASARGLVFDGAAQVAAADEIRRVVSSTGAQRLAHFLRLLVVLNEATAERRPLAGEWFVNTGDRNGRAAVEAGIAYIFDHLDGDVSLSSAARLAHMSDSAFSRYFKKASGLTFSAMVRKLRIANACRLLESSNMAVAAIASTTGYNNLANFNRQFLAETGMTPRDYRRRHGERLRDKLRPPPSTSGPARAVEG